jgi:hypothetical protein
MCLSGKPLMNYGFDFQWASWAMTMDRTAAKIGRRMKKWEKFMRGATPLDSRESQNRRGQHFGVRREAKRHAALDLATVTRLS